MKTTTRAPPWGWRVYCNGLLSHRDPNGAQAHPVLLPGPGTPTPTASTCAWASPPPSSLCQPLPASPTCCPRSADLKLVSSPGLLRTLAELTGWAPGHPHLPSEGWGDSGPGGGRGRRTAGAGMTQQQLSCSLAAPWEGLARNHFLPHPLLGFCPLASPLSSASPSELRGQDLQSPPSPSGAPGKPQVHSARRGSDRQGSFPLGLSGSQPPSDTQAWGRETRAVRGQLEAPALLPLELRWVGEKGLGRNAQLRVCGVPGGAPGAHSFILKAASLLLCPKSLIHSRVSGTSFSRLWGAFPWGALVDRAHVRSCP